MEIESTQKPIYFANLDILRFLAAFIVLFAHAYKGYCGWYAIPQSLSTEADPAQFSTIGSFVDQLIQNGGFGVDIFFMISGFFDNIFIIGRKAKNRND